VWIVSDAAPAEVATVRGVSWPGGGGHWDRILTRPDRLDWASLVATFNGWLARGYADAYFEWGYRGVPRRVIVEELLRARDGDVPDDYKILVFNGRPRLVQVDTGRHRDHRRNLYLPDWTPVEVEYVYPRAERETPRPASLDRMLALAERLGGETDCVRVDLYDIEGRVVFGELTNYPDAAAGAFTPGAFDEELGSWWTLPRRY
jgi:hypothetical protein